MRIEIARAQLSAVRLQLVALCSNICYISRRRWLHGRDSTSQQSGQGRSTRSCIVFAQADSDPAHLMELPAPVSKYLKAVVGGADQGDMLAVDNPWPSVCGRRAKTRELAQIPRICPRRLSRALYLRLGKETETAVSSPWRVVPLLVMSRSSPPCCTGSVKRALVVQSADQSDADLGLNIDCVTEVCVPDNVHKSRSRG